MRWTFLRAALARGWWLTTAVYLVVIAGLSPAQLVLIGSFQGATVVLSEVPAGVLADTVSRRLALVVAHVVSGAGMTMAAFVTEFSLLVVANCLWGMGWAFASGADVAWLTDELDDAVRVDRVLAAQGRWDLFGNPVGVASFGALAWVSSLATAMAAAGLMMIAVGVVIVARWPESRRPLSTRMQVWSSARAVLRGGIGVARLDRVVLVMLVATLLLNGAGEGYGRLYERRLLGLGMPIDPEPIFWFALLGLATVTLGVVSLRAVETRIDRTSVARRAYTASAAVSAAGVALFALASSLTPAIAAALLVAALAPIARVTATIRINRRATSDARATVHSLLSWSENVGEIVFGLSLALLAARTSATTALVGSALLLVAAGVTAGIVSDDRPSGAS